MTQEGKRGRPPKAWGSPLGSLITNSCSKDQKRPHSSYTSMALRKWLDARSPGERTGKCGGMKRNVTL